MTYLYTPAYALTLPECFRCGKGINPRIRFQWTGLREVSVSLGEETHLLKLRAASDSDRSEAVNRDGWAYIAPSGR